MFLFLSPLTFFGLPLFLFLFLCLSVVLFFFLPSCLSFLLSFCFLFLSLSFLFFLHCFCSMKRKTSKYSIAIFFLKCFLFFCFLSCFSVSNPFFLSLLFPDFKLCFLFNINVFNFKKNKLKSTKKNKKKQLQQNGFFFMNLCFAKCQKLSFFFLPLFLPIFGWCSKTL